MSQPTFLLSKYQILALLIQQDLSLILSYMIHLPTHASLDDISLPTFQMIHSVPNEGLCPDAISLTQLEVLSCNLYSFTA